MPIIEMAGRYVRRAVLAAGLVLLARPAAAQIPLGTGGTAPTPDQARQLLQSRPDLVAQLQARIGASGLTPDQIHDRLRSLGYPEDLLDPYMSGTAGTGTATAGDSERAVTAARQLGLISQEDSIGAVGPSSQTDLQSLELHRALRREAAEQADSLRILRDSLRADSLGLPYERPLRLFGLATFSNAPTTLQANQTGPVDENYRLGPGDRLALILTGEVEQAYPLDVTRDGFILIPQVGQLFVSNLTLGQLEDLLYARLGRAYSGVRRGPNARTHFEVTVTRIRTLQVYVTGEVQQPGAYQVSAAGTVLNAIYAAGGPTTQGDFRQVQLRRGGKLVDSLDLYDYLLRGVNSTEQRLQSGDVIFVPVHGTEVKVAGRVVRPAIYQLKPNETLRDVLQDAGGFAASAVRQRVQIHRIVPPDPRGGEEGAGRIVIDVGADQFAAGTVPAVPLTAGDSIVVFRVADVVRSFVRVEGNVWAPGVVGFQSGMKLSDAVRLAGGVRPDVYLGQVLITRLRNDSTRVQLRSTFADTTGRPTDDITLQDRDEVRVFSRTAFRTDRWVVITGAVRGPGRIPYREGMTVRDAVLLANGLAQDAYLKEAEIARVPEDRSHGEVAQTIRVPLDSTYLFSRGHPGEYMGPPGPPAPASGSPEVPLQPYDNVLILRQPESELVRTVKILGQVKYPGPYALRTKTDRLADLIQRAGGLTREAYPGGIEFVRTRDSTGRVGIDLPAVLKDAHDRDNVILAAGDSIYIPEFNPVVDVRGAVNAPGAVAYVPGKNLDFYVRGAGGYTQKSDREHTFVTQPDGRKEAVQRRFLLADGTPHPRPGAVVTVPQREGNQPPSQLPTILGVAAQVLASLVTLIVVAKR